MGKNYGLESALSLIGCLQKCLDCWYYRAQTGKQWNLEAEEGG